MKGHCEIFQYIYTQYKLPFLFPCLSLMLEAYKHLYCISLCTISYIHLTVLRKPRPVLLAVTCFVTHYQTSLFPSLCFLNSTENMHYLSLCVWIISCKKWYLLPFILLQTSGYHSFPFLHKIAHFYHIFITHSLINGFSGLLWIALQWAWKWGYLFEMLISFPSDTYWGVAVAES